MLMELDFVFPLCVSHMAGSRCYAETVLELARSSIKGTIIEAKHIVLLSR